jgi:hypothetical protein
MEANVGGDLERAADAFARDGVRRQAVDARVLQRNSSAVG